MRLLQILVQDYFAHTPGLAEALGDTLLDGGAATADRVIRSDVWGSSALDDGVISDHALEAGQQAAGDLAADGAGQAVLEGIPELADALEFVGLAALDLSGVGLLLRLAMLVGGAGCFWAGRRMYQACSWLLRR